MSASWHEGQTLRRRASANFGQVWQFGLSFLLVISCLSFSVSQGHLLWKGHGAPPPHDPVWPEGGGWADDPRRPIPLGPPRERDLIDQQATDGLTHRRDEVFLLTFAD